MRVEIDSFQEGCYADDSLALSPPSDLQGLVGVPLEDLSVFFLVDSDSFDEGDFDADPEAPPEPDLDSGDSEGDFFLTDNSFIWLADDQVVFTGSDSDEEIWTSMSDSTVDGSGGNDYIEGWDGNDLLLGGEGNDTLDGLAGKDTLMGGSGDDTLRSQWGSATLDGGSGNDTIEIWRPSECIGLVNDPSRLSGEEGQFYIELVPFDCPWVLLFQYFAMDDQFISGGEGDDTLMLSGYSSTDISTVEQSGNALLLQFDDGSELTLVDQFAGGTNGVEHFTLNDTTLTAADLAAMIAF